MCELWRKMRLLLLRRRADRDLAEEMQLHLEMKMAAEQETGVGEEEARHRAMRAFGNATQLREQGREAWGFRWLEELARDVRYGWRMLARSPGFAAVAVLSLALGIGANTAMFSLIDAVMLKMLPVHEPERLVRLEIPGERGGSYGFSYPLYEALRDHNQTLAGIFAVARRSFNVSVDGRVELAAGGGLFASGGYFSTLGVKAIAGRLFTEEDDKLPDSGGPAGPVAVISYNYWQRRFALDPGVIGKTIGLNGRPLTLIGVTPPGFFGVAFGVSPDVTVPMKMFGALNQGSTLLGNRGSWWLNVMGRLRPGVPAGRAAADLNVAFQQYLAETGGETQRNFANKKITAEPGSQGISRMDAPVRLALLVLMAAVTVVLLIACANVANLLLARGAVRQREMALRVSVGAGRARLVRQLLTESLLLAVMGGTAGLLLASWGTRGILKLFHAGEAPIPIDLSPDAGILAFTAAVSLAASIGSGLAPALRAARVDLTAALKAGSRRATGGALLGPQGALVVPQVALSLVLLVVASLLARSLQNLMLVNLGFHPEHVLVVSVDPALVGYKGEHVAGLYKALLERMDATPGVLSASFSVEGLISGHSWQNHFSVPGDARQPKAPMESNFSPVGAHFFRTAGIGLLAGRDFGPQDNESAPKVAVVSEALALEFFGPAGSAVGRKIGLGVNQNLGVFEIVGVAQDAKYGSLREPPQRVIYFPFLQLPPRMMGQATLEARTAAEPNAMIQVVRRQLLAVDKNLPVFGAKTLTQQVHESLMTERAVAALAGVFGLLALALACVGLYGVMSYSVARRTGEIGIRMALGAQSGDVVRMVLREALALVLVGVAVGLAAALAAGRVLGSLLFGLAPADGVAIAAATLALAAVAAVAGWLPARRASRVDPMVALRYE